MQNNSKRRGRLFGEALDGGSATRSQKRHELNLTLTHTLTYTVTLTVALTVTLTCAYNRRAKTTIDLPDKSEWTGFDPWQ